MCPAESIPRRKLIHDCELSVLSTLTLSRVESGLVLIEFIFNGVQGKLNMNLFALGIRNCEVCVI